MNYHEAKRKKREQPTTKLEEEQSNENVAAEGAQKAVPDAVVE